MASKSSSMGGTSRASSADGSISTNRRTRKCSNRTMGHVIEPAATGRSKCRACGRAIAKDDLRFGEELPNPFADGFIRLWFHVPCAAFRRPAAFLETATAENVPNDFASLKGAAER